MTGCESFVIRLVGDEPSSLLDLPRLRARFFYDRGPVTELLTDGTGATSVQINDERPVRQGEDSAFGVGVVVHATTLLIRSQDGCHAIRAGPTAGKGPPRALRVNAW